MQLCHKRSAARPCPRPPGSGVFSPRQGCNRHDVRPRPRPPRRPSRRTRARRRRTAKRGAAPRQTRTNRAGPTAKTRRPSHRRRRRADRGAAAARRTRQQETRGHRREPDPASQPTAEGRQSEGGGGVQCRENPRRALGSGRGRSALGRLTATGRRADGPRGGEALQRRASDDARARIEARGDGAEQSEARARNGAERSALVASPRRGDAGDQCVCLAARRLMTRRMAATPHGQAGAWLRRLMTRRMAATHEAPAHGCDA